MATRKRLWQVITEEELIKILKETESPHHILAFCLGFYQAMRISEIVKLKPENVDKKKKLIHIVNAKRNKDRMIPISPKVINGLKHLPIGCKERALQMKFKKVALKALGKDLYFHILRHSGVTYYITKMKWSTLEVQRFAGHSKVSTTEIYTHVQPEDLIARMWTS